MLKNNKVAYAACVAATAGILAVAGLAGCSGTSSQSATSSSASSSSVSASAASDSASTSSESSAASSNVSDSASSASVEAKKTAGDYGWVSFTMPEGWSDADESDKYVTIREDENDRHCIKLFQKTLPSSVPTAAAYAAQEVAEHADKYKDGGKKKIGERTWYLVNFEFNGNPSFYAYADAGDKKCVYATVYELEVDEPAVEKVLSTLIVSEEDAE